MNDFMNKTNPNSTLCPEKKEVLTSQHVVKFETDFPDSTENV